MSYIYDQFNLEHFHRLSGKKAQSYRMAMKAKRMGLIDVVDDDVIDNFDPAIFEGESETVEETPVETTDNGTDTLDPEPTPDVEETTPDSEEEVPVQETEEVSEEEVTTEDTVEETVAESPAEVVAETPTEEVAEEPTTEPDIKDLRAQYEDKFGKKPFNGWSVEQLLEKLEG